MRATIRSTTQRPRGAAIFAAWPALTLAIAAATAPLEAQVDSDARVDRGARVDTRAPVDTIDLTLEGMVELALSNSYQVRFLNMSVEQTRHRLRAERARLRSNVSLDLSAPDFQSISETKWNSVDQRNEIVHENSRRWEGQLSIRQPVILFGYPTNGYLSLNNRVYRYSQRETDGSDDVTYYNRYFVRYTQPLFQPNSLKNSLEEAELDLEDAEIDFYDDVLEIVDDVSDDYLRLFENAFEQSINSGYVENLESGEAAAREAIARDSSRTIELDQIRVELANAREQLQRARSEFRIQAARLKTGLNLPESDVITIDPRIRIRPVTIDVERAIRFARELTPRLRQLAISRRENEIRLEQTKGRNSFRLDLEFTYGREMRDPIFREMWGEPTNTYTVDVNASVPIWDWGERDARIESQRISVRRTELQIEQAEAQIVSNVQNEVRTLEELQNRTIAMQENLALATGISRESLSRYRDGQVSALDLIQSFRREADTANNFLDAYLDWRRSLLRLKELTYWDFEFDLPVLERFGIDVTDTPTGEGPRLGGLGPG